MRRISGDDISRGMARALTCITADDFRYQKGQDHVDCLGMNGQEGY